MPVFNMDTMMHKLVFVTYLFIDLPFIEYVRKHGLVSHAKNALLFLAAKSTMDY